MGRPVRKRCTENLFFLLGDRAQAEDATQDTFMKAWRNISKFAGRNGCSEKTWLIRIAINTCRDYKRTRWFRHVDMSVEINHIPQGEYELFPSDWIVLGEMMRLPEKYKQVILLHYYQHFSVEEIAQAVSVHVSTVHRRLKKAAELLRSILIKEGFK